MCVQIAVTAQVFAQFPLQTHSAGTGKISISMPDFRLSDDKKGIELEVPDTPRAVSEEKVFPEKYDMRDDFQLSGVKDQLNYGTCWVESAIASAESSVIKSDPTVDLSEFHSAFYAYCGEDQVSNGSDDAKSILMAGGNAAMVTNLWAQWIGPVREDRMPYDVLEGSENWYNNYDMKYTADYHLKNAFHFDYEKDHSNRETVDSMVKEFVMSGESVDVSFYQSTSDCYNSSKNCTNSDKKPVSSNHSVIIVGWDDSFPAENFKIKPEGDGAWLVRNSWNVSQGDNGFMWISYYDPSLCEFAVYELDDKENFQTNFQHDTYVPVQSMTASENGDVNEPSYIANVFRSENEQTIDAISLYIRENPTDYEITVYSDIKDPSDPCSGTPSEVTSGTADKCGYVTIELDKSVYVKQDSSFSIVVKLFSEQSPYVIPIETCIAVTDDESGERTSLGSYTSADKLETYTLRGESFYGVDGESWSDVVDGEYVYTEEEEQELLEELNQELLDGIDTTDPDAVETVDGVMGVYRNMFASGSVSVILGNISMKAFGNPVGKVNFSHISGEVGADERVSLSTADDSEIKYSVNGGEEKVYTEPIPITEPVEIWATVNGEDFYYREYRPQTAQPNAIGYRVGSGDISYAEKVGEYDYRILLSGNYYKKVNIYPVSGVNLSIDGEPLKNNDFTSIALSDEISTQVKINAQSEGMADGVINLNIVNAERCEMGDVNADGLVDASDASDVLGHYASLSTGFAGTIPEALRQCADMNSDDFIDASDASDILVKYALLSTGGEV